MVLELDEVIFLGSSGSFVTRTLTRKEKKKQKWNFFHMEEFPFIKATSLSVYFILPWVWRVAVGGWRTWGEVGGL